MRHVVFAVLLLGMLLSCARAQTMYIDAGNADRVHLREEASTDSKSYGLYFSGTPVEAVGSVEDFTVVSIGTENGFIKSEYLKSEPGGIESALRVGTIKTGVSHVNLRRHAGDAKVIDDVECGDTVTVMGETASGWYYVKHGDVTGYMKSSLVRLGGKAAMESTRREQLIFVSHGEQMTAELHDVGGGEYEREYRVRFLTGGKEICVAGFTGDPYEHLRRFETDGGSPVMHATDVNMDGHADVSVIRYTGATEAQAAHFLYDPQSGRYERYKELDTLSWWRCELYPKTQMMLNHIRDGAACGTWELYQWEGMEHRLLATGRISYGNMAQTLNARVFRESEVVYEASWEQNSDDGSEWQRQLSVMLDVLWGGMEPGEPTLLDSAPTDSMSVVRPEEGSNG